MHPERLLAVQTAGGQRRPSAAASASVMTGTVGVRLVVADKSIGLERVVVGQVPCPAVADRLKQQPRGDGDRRDAVVYLEAVANPVTPAGEVGIGGGDALDRHRLVHRSLVEARTMPTKPSSPSPTDAVRDGSAKLGHPVQNVTREHGLTPLPR